MLNARKRARGRNSPPENGGSQSHSQKNGVGGTSGATAPAAVHRNRLSMSEVSDMLYEFYKANVAKAPKNEQQPHKYGQASPTSAETHEPATIAAIATNGAAASHTAVESPLVIDDDELMEQPAAGTTAITSSTFHPRIKYTNKSAGMGTFVSVKTVAAAEPTRTSIPTSVVVMPTASPQQDIKPIINPTTGFIISPGNESVANESGTSSISSPATVIKAVPAAESVLAAAPPSGVVVPQAAALAAALLRDGYHNFQQQLRAQELLKQQNNLAQTVSSQQPQELSNGNTPTKILENFLRQQQQQRDESMAASNAAASDTNDGDDEDDSSRYNGFDDIHLVEGGTPKHGYGNNPVSNIFQNAASVSGSPANASAGAGASASASADYMSDESQKFIMAAQAQAQVLRNLEFSLGDYASSVSCGSRASNDGISPKGGIDGEPVYECCHCGKRYRWKSTLRRHENVECGGKEPGHECPYCNYKSKQRGNLGVHVRKHHANMPQLASKRRSKYSQLIKNEINSGNYSDDSSSKLIIDCSK